MTNSLTNYTTVDKAIVVSTGNTLVMSGITGNTYPIIVSDATTAGMVNAMGGLTQDWTQSASQAHLSIKENSTILFAQLVWYSTIVNDIYGAPDVSSVQDQAITFTTPTGTQLLTPEYSENIVINNTVGQRLINRMRTRDITSLIALGGSGTYLVGGVPTSIQASGLSTTRAGWAIHVVYKHDDFSPKYINIANGVQSATSEGNIQRFYNGFQTPSTGNISGKMTFVVANGEPYSPGELLKVGNSFSTLQTIGNSIGVGHTNPLTSPNNPYDNPFTGQINIADPLNINCGLLDTMGTLGNLNNDGFIPSEIPGARNKWDIACIDISNKLTLNQSQLAFQLNTNNSSTVYELLTTIVQLDAKGANLLSSFIIDESYVEIDDIATYRLSIQNIGSVQATNIFVQDILNSSITFVPDSILVNGIRLIGENITTGISIGTLNGYESVTIIYDVKPINLNGPIVFTNTATYSYDFLSGPTSPTYTNSKETGPVNFSIDEGSLTITKVASVQTTDLFGSIEYTLTLENIGTVSVNQVFIRDIVDANTTFTPNSVYVGGNLLPLADITTGLNISTIGIGASVVIKYSVTVSIAPYYGVVEDKAYATYSYALPQYQAIIRKTAVSNAPQVLVNYANVIQILSNDNNYPVLNDIITYTITYQNTGNINANNVPVYVQMPYGVEFVLHSVKIDGVANTEANPVVPPGFTLTEVCPCQSTVVTFQGKVLAIPDAQQVVNIAMVPFEYQLDPNGNIITTEIDSNKVYTRTNNVSLSVVKSVDKAYATIGDKLVYKIDITNTGNIDATNVHFMDILDSHLTFVPGSVKIDGTYQVNANPNTGFVIPNLSTTDTYSVSFLAEVNSLPRPSIIYNQAQITYDFKPDPTGITITNTKSSNIVSTSITTATLNLTKEVDKTIAQIGDTITYTIKAMNQGIVTLNNLFLADTVDSNVSFIPGTVTIDTIPYPTYDPNIGFILQDSLLPGEENIITFKVLVNTLPVAWYVKNHGSLTYSYQLNPFTPIYTTTQSTNYVKTKIVNPVVSIKKSVDKTYATLNDILTYEFIVENKGNISATNVVLQDSLQSDGLFQPGTVVINGLSAPNANPNMGFAIGDIEVGKVAIISFQTKVITVPVPNVINNSAIATYQYQVDLIYTNSATSNTVQTYINTGSMTVTKAVDKTYATINEIINYTLLVHNTGNVVNSNVVLTDMIPQGAEFITTSVRINNVAQVVTGPNLELPLPDISAGSTTTIQFQVKVISLPLTQTLVNSANVTYTYRINPEGPNIPSTSTSNTVTTYINLASVTIAKSVNKVYATVNDELTYSIDITNHGNINLTNVYFLDMLDSYTTFKPDSLKVDGVAKPVNPNVSFLLTETLVPNQTINVSFIATVNAVPPIGYVNNIATINYTYQINPAGELLSQSLNSNQTTTYINKGTLTVSKEVNRTVATIADVLTYSFVVVNTGNTDLTGLNFKDIVQQDGSTFVSGSVKVNDSSIGYTSVNPTTGFTLPNLPIGQSLTVSFNVTVTAVPSNTEHIINGNHVILNTATVDYSYKVDPTSSNLTNLTVTSNTTTVIVKYSELSITKSVIESVGKVGDTLHYSFILANTGYSNVAANNVILTDMIDSNLTYNALSIKVDGVDATAQASYINHTLTLNLDTIALLQTKLVEFTATISTMPESNYVYNNGEVNYTYTAGTVISDSMMSNTVKTQVYKPELTATKAVDKLYATVNDELTYSLTIHNTGSLPALNLVITDLDPIATQFVAGSVVIDGVIDNPLTPQNPNNGITLPTLAPNATTYVSFKVKVTSLPANPYLVKNTASVNFDYLIPGSTQLQPAPTTYTNEVTTHIVLAKLDVTKAVDKAYATNNEEITYTVTATNNGNEPLTNLIFHDVLQTDIEFVPQSIIIDNVPQPTATLPSFTLTSSLAMGASITVVFKAKVKPLAPPVYVYNIAIIDFNYKIDPAGSAPTYTGHSMSNTVSTKINIAALTATKAVDKAYATLQDTLMYTITLTNTGSVNLTELNLLDLIPTGATFIPGSVLIDEISKPLANPEYSIALNTIPVGTSQVIRFEALVTSVPVVNPIVNNAQVTYSYRIAPTDPDTVVEKSTNNATTQINLGRLTMTKTVDKSYAIVGDELTYSILLENKGNVVVSQVTFVDILQTDILFVTGSVTVGGVTTAYDPNLGFALPDINPGASILITFRATVELMPVTTFVDNIATGTYSYQIDPQGAIITVPVTSNSVRTVIKQMTVMMHKYVDKTFATLNDTLLYSVTIGNYGTVSLTDVMFTDPIPAHTQLVPGMVYLGETIVPSANPATGINLGTIHPGEMKTVSFIVQITELPPTPYIIPNTGSATFKYKIDPMGADINGSITSNTVETRVNLGQLTLTKSVNKAYALVNDLLIYSVLVKNTGNVVATNTVFLDQLQTELSFISGTVSIDNIQNPTLNPTTGFTLGDLQPGQEKNISFDVRISTYPPTGIVENTGLTQFSYQIDPAGLVITSTTPSNLVTTHVVNPVLTSLKYVSKTYATMDDIYTYTITLNNTGNTDLKDAIFRDTPSIGVTLVPQTIKINGVLQPLLTSTTEIPLGDLIQNTLTTITFDVKVTSVPTSGMVTNKAYIDYSYTVDPLQPVVTKTSQTNLVTTYINVYGMTVVKTVDKAFATPGAILTYSVTVTNTGNVPNTNVIFNDPTPANTTVVLGSVILNGTPQPTYHPEAGFSLGTMMPGQVAVVIYQVRIND